jgi:hypothetical protein
MTAVYPGALATIAANKEDDTDAGDGSDGGVSTSVGDHAAHHNQLADELVAVQTELGVDPAGTFVTVAARLNARLTCRKTADQSLTTQTLANLTDLSLVIPASVDITYKFVIMWSIAGTARGTGWSTTFGGTNTSNTTRVAIGGVTATTGGTDFETVGSYNAHGTTISNAATIQANVNFITVIEGIMQVGASGGTLQVQGRQGTGATAANVTIRKGSYGEVYIN